MTDEQGGSTEENEKTKEGREKEKLREDRRWKDGRRLEGEAGILKDVAQTFSSLSLSIAVSVAIISYRLSV